MDDDGASCRLSVSPQWRFTPVPSQGACAGSWRACIPSSAPPRPAPSPPALMLPSPASPLGDRKSSGVKRRCKDPQPCARRNTSLERGAASLGDGLGKVILKQRLEQARNRLHADPGGAPQAPALALIPSSRRRRPVKARSPQRLPPCRKLNANTKNTPSDCPFRTPFLCDWSKGLRLCRPGRCDNGDQRKAGNEKTGTAVIRARWDSKARVVQASTDDTILRGRANRLLRLDLEAMPFMSAAGEGKSARVAPASARLQSATRCCTEASFPRRSFRCVSESGHRPRSRPEHGNHANPPTH